MTEPLVDVIVPVHSATRPIARAVRSVVEHNDAAVRVLVVAHNIDEATIRRNLGDYVSRRNVEVLALSDGIPSPAGPFNFGLDHSTAKFASVMGSDDELEPGAIDSWVSLQRSSGASVVIGRVRMASGATVASPPARPGRSLSLDPVKDRLSYRSAPLGLFSRDAFGELRFPEHLASGEDIWFVSRLWFSGRSIAFDRKGPAYVVNGDAEDRVTTAPRPVRDDFAFLDGLLDDALLNELDHRERFAIAVKLLRTNLFDAVLNRSQLSAWTDVDRRDIAGITERILRWGGPVENVLSLVDRGLLRAITRRDSPISVANELVARRSKYTRLPAILTSNPLFALHRQAPLRTLAAGFLVQRGR
jgi:hypothetical protein